MSLVPKAQGQEGLGCMGSCKPEYGVGRWALNPKKTQTLKSLKLYTRLP